MKGYDKNTAERVRQILAGQRDVVEKRMVGGLSFMVNGNMACGVTSTALMVRVGPEAYEQALAQPYVRPMTFAGRPLRGYVCVDPAGYQTDTALAAWVQRGVAFVATLPTKPPAVRIPRPKAPRRWRQTPRPLRAPSPPERYCSLGGYRLPMARRLTDASTHVYVCMRDLYLCKSLPAEHEPRHLAIPLVPSLRAAAHHTTLTPE